MDPVFGNETTVLLVSFLWLVKCFEKHLNDWLVDHFKKRDLFADVNVFDCTSLGSCIS